MSKTSSTSPPSTSTSTADYDVIIIGGSYSGLQASLTLGRSLRNVLVVDNGQPCNRYTPHTHNLLTYDGSIPSTISQLGKKQIQMNYGSTVTFLDNDSIIKGSSNKSSGGSGSGSGSGKEKDEKDASTTTPNTTIFTIETKSGKVFTCRKIIVASGVIDEIPTHIPGFEECWGKSIIHCPYCHGYEYHSKRTGLYLTKKQQYVNMAFSHLLPLLNNLTNQIYIILDDNSSSS